MILQAPAVIFPDFDTFSYTANSQKFAVGTKGQDKLGRCYRYAQAGAANLVVGNVLASQTVNGSQINLAVNTALAIVGATSFTVTPGAAIVANQYRGGTLTVSNGGGLGFVYTLASHAAGNSTVNVVFNLDVSESIQVAANSSTRVNLVYNEYVQLVVCPTAFVSTPVGVAVSPIPANNYGWIGVHGGFAAIYEGDVVAAAPAGTGVGPSQADAGSVAVQLTSNAASSDVLIPQIGILKEVGVDLKPIQCFFTIE